MVQKYLKLLIMLVLVCSFFSSGTAIAPSSAYEITLTEGEIAEIQNGYYLTVMDIDTYDETVSFAVSYYDTMLWNQYYARGDYFYYQDNYLTLQFKINDLYYDSYYDYVVLSDVYIYPDYTVTYDESGVVSSRSDYNTDHYDYPDTSAEDAFYELIGVLLVILVAVLVLRKMSGKDKKKKERKKQEKITVIPPVSLKERTSQTFEAAESAVAAKAASKEPAVIKSAIQYKGANILYKIKVENTSEEPMGDITISLFVPEVFHVKESQKNISMLQPGEGKTATFIIRPTGECGNCVLAGNIRYYDYSQKKHVQVDLSNKMVDIVCPVLRVREIDEAAWRMNVGSMMIAEEDTKDLEIPAENLFDMATRILKDMNMYMITPEVTSTQQLFTGVARFYAEGVAGLKYAAYVEVVGKRKSRLIVKAWAEKEEALTGFYHKILEEIEKRTDIKLFVDDSVTQYNISNTTIQDSIIQRSNIGTGKRKCPQCGREAEGSEKFCINCGQKLD
ncbi:zinc ribbon domain-containing protein [Methanolobus psychrotolerans]|uniref:zinc ribbon domain-containing protein n=1 Tax=Methanolobus psychrotolerans TaxID=1874706 RepID=UPI00101AE094|nr:zinc ribbon domain-containing protein [Methanolobus psychrotolerans]